VRAKRFNAAAEAAVGLTLIIAISRHCKTTNRDPVDAMKQ
jgi:NADH:ubiquinone oxidoreductase subunit K